eukprot:9740_1
MEDKLISVIQKGDIHLTQKNYLKALNCYTKCICKINKQPQAVSNSNNLLQQALLNRAKCYAAMNQMPSGMQDIEKCIKIDAKSELAIQAKYCRVLLVDQTIDFPHNFFAAMWECIELKDSKLVTSQMKDKLKELEKKFRYKHHFSDRQPLPKDATLEMMVKQMIMSKNSGIQIKTSAIKAIPMFQKMHHTCFDHRCPFKEKEYYFAFINTRCRLQFECVECAINVAKFIKMEKDKDKIKDFFIKRYIPSKHAISIMNGTELPFSGPYECNKQKDYLADWC